MSKRTTADCKKFLVDFFTKNSQIINAFFPGSPIASSIYSEKGWKRLWKSKADNNPCWNTKSKGYLCYVSGQPVNRYGEGLLYITEDKFTVARGFDCSEYEGQIAFIVLEDAEGNLTLGNYIGD